MVCAAPYITTVPTQRTLLLLFTPFTNSSAASVTAGMVIVGGGALGVELAISFSSSVMSALKSAKSGVEMYLHACFDSCVKHVRGALREENLGCRLYVCVGGVRIGVGDQNQLRDVMCTSLPCQAASRACWSLWAPSWPLLARNISCPRRSCRSKCPPSPLGPWWCGSRPNHPRGPPRRSRSRRRHR